MCEHVTLSADLIRDGCKEPMQLVILEYSTALLLECVKIHEDSGDVVVESDIIRCAALCGSVVESTRNPALTPALWPSWQAVAAVAAVPCFGQLREAAHCGDDTLLGRSEAV
jgi:hypothetical protein